jgi:hypothetical protein
MRRVILLLAAIAFSLVVFGGVAYAQDHQPPKTLLYKGERELQSGRLGSYCWFSSSGAGECADAAELVYPAVDRVRAGSTLHVRILEEQRPQKFSISAYRQVDEWGFPAGKTQRLDTSMQRVIEDGETVAWDVFFRVNKPGRHYYLDAFGVWEDAGDASWNFHVKTRG